MIAPLQLCAGALVAVASIVLFSGEAPGQQRLSAAVTATRDLPRGHLLELEDLRFEGGAEGAPLPGGEASADPHPVGWVTRRVISAGEPLRAPAIAPAEVIRAGEMVHAIWVDGALELRLEGRALNSAAAGQPVRVRLDLRRTVQGIADGVGTVRLADPRAGGV